MAESKKLIILQALTAHLEKINGADPYEFDVEGKVYRGRSKFDGTEDLPMLSLLEAPRPEFSNFAGDFNARSEDWVLMLQGWNDDDARHPTDCLYRFMADVEKCLGQVMAERADGSGRPEYPDVYRLGGLVSHLSFGPGVVRPANEGVSTKACFYLLVRIALAGDVG